MSPILRITGFTAALVGVFALALVVGRGLGPIGDDEASGDGGMDHESMESPVAGVELPGGLMVSSGGYTFSLDRTTTRPGRAVAISFRITGPGAEPVTAYDVEHEKQLHLIAVRRDLTGFQHVHPALDLKGTWSTELALTPGDWRLFADFKPTDGDPVTLGADVQVAGRYRPVPTLGESRTSTVDGYEVSIGGDLTPGSDSKLTLSVTRNGEPVTDLQPYLGAYGHLVALREGDLAYLHVHPEGTPDDGLTQPGPSVVFYAAVPTAGDYRLFLNFKHGDVVRTALFALSADHASEPGESMTPSTESGHAGH